MTELLNKPSYRIALGHQARVGKDTFADIMGENMEISRFAFATVLKKMATDLQSILGKTVEKDPTLLQNLGSALRKTYGDDLFALYLEAELRALIDCDPNINIVITDMREVSEMEMLQRLGFTTVKITREGRIIDRDPNHSSEIALRNSEFDFNIANDGSMDLFREQVIAVLDAIGMLSG